MIMENLNNPRKMKILIIASWYPESGQQNGSFFRDRATALAEQGCEVSVAVAELRFRTKTSRCEMTVSNEDGVHVYRAFKRNLTPFWEGGIARQKVSMIRRIYEQVCADHGKPDIIHLESARCALAAEALVKREGIPMTYTEHYSGVLNSKPGSYYDKMMRRALSCAEHTFLISSAMQKKIAPPDGKWSMLPNEVDFSAFTLCAPFDTHQPFVFKALGSLRKIKGYDLLIEAFSLVHKKYPNSRLVIGGRGEEMNALVQLRDQLALSDCVELAGNIELNDRNAFFHDAAAFVCSSHTETFSVVTIEAFACGVPVVATKCGGPEDLVNETNGYLVEKASVSALVEGMLRMIKNRQMFSSDEIRRQAMNVYDRNIVVTKQLNKFKQIMFAYHKKEELG